MKIILIITIIIAFIAGYLTNFITEPLYKHIFIERIKPYDSEVKPIIDLFSKTKYAIYRNYIYSFKGSKYFTSVLEDIYDNETIAENKLNTVPIGLYVDPMNPSKATIKFNKVNTYIIPIISYIILLVFIILCFKYTS